MLSLMLHQFGLIFVLGGFNFNIYIYIFLNASSLAKVLNIVLQLKTCETLVV